MGGSFRRLALMAAIASAGLSAAHSSVSLYGADDIRPRRTTDGDRRRIAAAEAKRARKSARLRK